MASTKLTRNHSGSPTSRKKMTWSWWIKRGVLGATQYLYNQYRSADSYNSGVLFQSDDSMRFWDYGAASNDIDLQTTRLFRDVNSWYHIVLAIDTTQGTASNRVKLYVNGVQETAFDVATYPSQDHQLRMGEAGSAYQQQIGFQGFGSTYQSYFDGVMSHVHYVDGTQYSASDFGSTDSTTGEWKINTSPSVTYGNNGFFILKNGNSVTDSSSNSNAFTVAAGTLTKTEDCPSNVFCTWNRINKGSNIDMNYGNTNIYGNTNNNGNTWGTISFPPSGKYYWETKVIAYNSGGTGYPQIGIIRDNTISQGTMNGGNDGYVASSKDCYYPVGGTTVYSKNGNITISATSLNDVIMCAMDSTAGNMKFWMGVNGTWWNSGDPANGTNAIWTETGDYQSVPFIAGYNASRGDTNFGNGYFGTTAVSSAGTNASGNGIFEYDVPTGFTALSTKGMNL